MTPSDLERHAARSHFYLLVAGIEMLLAQIVRSAIDPAVILTRLDGDSRERWEADRTDDAETNPAEYLYVRDLAELFLEVSEATSKRDWEPRLINVLTDVCKFRPTVMHANRPLIKGRSIAQLAALATGAAELMERLEEIAAAPGTPTG